MLQLRLRKKIVFDIRKKFSPGHQKITVRWPYFCQFVQHLCLIIQMRQDSATRLFAGGGNRDDICPTNRNLSSWGRGRWGWRVGLFSKPLVPGLTTRQSLNFQLETSSSCWCRSYHGSIAIFCISALSLTSLQGQFRIPLTYQDYYLDY